MVNSKINSKQVLIYLSIYPVVCVQRNLPVHLDTAVVGERSMDGGGGYIPFCEIRGKLRR